MVRTIIAAGLGGLTLFSLAPAQAADCKAPITGRSRSAAATSDIERLRLARDDAIAHWRQIARETHGWRYRYWTAAQNKRVRCTAGAGSRSCVVVARPCLTAS